jgi:ubiquinone biosynthesis protein
MKKPGQLIRLFYINYVMARRGIDRVVLSAPLFSGVRFLSSLNPWNWRRTKNKTPGESVRLALEDLGPIFVKFGQMLSTRQDLLSEDMIAELERLQDRVPPFPSHKAQEIVEKALKRPIAELFAEFSLEPMASASIAQVHAATLHDGRQVVVKIRRPGIEKIISRDLGLMYFVAGCAERFWSHGRRLHLRDLVREFEHTIIDELDFLHEASNASQLRRNFKGSALLHVPEVHWEYTTNNVFVMERIFGVQISDVSALKAAGVNLKKLSEHGVEIFFTQVFRDSFFHADMHPGNIFVSIDDPENPRYMAVDFGIMGSLGPLDQHYLAENLLAFFKRDYRRVAILHVESGWIPAGTRVEEFESAIRSVCEPIFEKPLRDISFAQLLLRLFQTAGRFNMEIQPQLFLLQKTLLHIEGLGRRLYPDLDLWVTAKPFLERWMRRRYSPRTLLKKWFRQAPYVADKLMTLPGLWQDVLLQQKNTQAMLAAESTKFARRKKGLAVKYFLLGVSVMLLIVAGLVFL